MSEEVRRRQQPRVKLPGEVRGSVRGNDEVRVLTLSPGGATLEHAERLTPGEACILSLRLGGLDFRLPARVVWSRLYRREATPPAPATVAYRSGLHFVQLPGDTEHNLREYLASVRPLRS